MFDLDQLVADCRSALKADKSHKLVREVVARAVSDPAAVLRALGEPKCAAIQSCTTPVISPCSTSSGPLG
jgi:hypothetical protein